MDYVKGVLFGSGKPLPNKLCGKQTDTFCYLSIKDRHPVTLTKIINQVFKMGLAEPSLTEDTKSVAAKLSRLKSRLQTDKELELLEGEGEDVKLWNTAIEGLSDRSWFGAPWLFVECYMYRYIHAAFQDTKHLRYPKFDVFAEEKQRGLKDSLGAMAQLWAPLSDVTSITRDVIATCVKFSLWGNKTDLSLLEHFNLNLGDVQSSSVEGDDGRILANDLGKVVECLLGLENAHVGIVLDNSGYELFSDLCLCDALLRSGHISKVTLHQKSLPWFVSDVTPVDFDVTLSTLTAIQELSGFAERLTEHRSSGRLIATEHLFWTSPHPFCEMEAMAPELHEQLAACDLVFFKGDLNYRKLVNDRTWPYDTTFSAALEGFSPTKICALRTVKSDSVVGCESDRVSKILSEDRDSMFCGSYALVSTNF